MQLPRSLGTAAAILPSSKAAHFPKISQTADVSAHVTVLSRVWNNSSPILPGFSILLLCEKVRIELSQISHRVMPPTENPHECGLQSHPNSLDWP